MDGHIHKYDLLARILKCPRQSTSVDDVGVGCRIVIVQPDDDSVVNESLVERKVLLEEWEDVYLLVDCNLQI